MKYILVLADGPVAKAFIETIGKKRIAKNQYTIVYYRDETLPEDIGNNCQLHHADPTSYSKLAKVALSKPFEQAVVVMQERSDAVCSLKNLSLLLPKVRKVANWSWRAKLSGENYQNIFYVDNQVMATNHLYGQLPNAPLIAQNIGLGEGEIMEIRVPFGSSYSYRHVASIAQNKWRIAALYRENKQYIQPQSMMIRPDDTLLVVGKPMVLDGLYRAINKRSGIFPEPYGGNLYLLLNLESSKAQIKKMIDEAIYLTSKTSSKRLYVRVMNPDDFELLNWLKEHYAKEVEFLIDYQQHALSLIDFDCSQLDIGLIFASRSLFREEGVAKVLYELKRLVYLYGEESLLELSRVMVLMSDEHKMESVSSSAFEVADAIKGDLSIAEFDPEGAADEDRGRIIDHFESLSEVFGVSLNHDYSEKNPIRSLRLTKKSLIVAPFEESMKQKRRFAIFSKEVSDHLIDRLQLSILLVPFEKEIRIEGGY